MARCLGFRVSGSGFRVKGLGCEQYWQGVGFGFIHTLWHRAYVFTDLYALFTDIYALFTDIYALLYTYFTVAQGLRSLFVECIKFRSNIGQGV